MRYHSQQPEVYSNHYGKTYRCNHPVYDSCTLFKIDGYGLAVIQQYRREQTKATWWGPIYPWLADDIYLHPKFFDYFRERASKPDKDGLYPTVTVRQIMWSLRMKPLRRERWETVFDRKKI